MKKDSQTTKFFRATSTPALIISHYKTTFIITEVTDSFIIATGIKRELLIGNSIFDFFSKELPEEPTRLLETIQTVIQSKETIKAECIDFLTDHSISEIFDYFICDIDCIPVPENEEVAELILSLTNITCQRKVEEKSSDENEDQDELLSGSWSYDIKTDNYTFSDEVKKIYGIESSALKPTMETIRLMVHPNDVAKRNRIINHAYATGTEYYLSIRIIRKDKKVKNIVVIGRPQKDLEGNLIGYEGLTKNVVEYKLLEKRLFETLFDLHKNNKIIESLILNIPVGIALNKISTGETSFVNDEFSNVYGLNNSNNDNLNNFLAKIYPIQEERNEILRKLHSNEDVDKCDLKKWQEVEIITENGEQKIINTKHIPLLDQDMLITTSIDVTEKEKLLLDLHKAIERYNLVSMATDDAVFDWDINHNTIFWKNSILTEALGYQEGIERNTLKEWVDGIHPDDTTAFKESLISFLKNKNATKWMPDYYRVIKADGTYAHIKELSLVVRNEEGRVIRMVGVLRDVSRRKAEELRLKMLELVVENMGDPVVITEADPLDFPGPKIIYANPSFLKLTGYSADEVLGKTPRVLQGKLSEREELKKLKESMIACTSYKLSTVNYKKDGTPIWIKAHISPVFDESGKCINWVGVQRDITEEKKAELLLQELNKNLITQTEKLELSNKELEQFAYIASHDLQEPLRMIISFLGLLEKKFDKNIDEKGKQYIHFAVDGAQRLRQIIFDLLDYSRVGRLVYPDQIIDLNDLLKEIKHALHSRITEQKAVIVSSNLPSIMAKKTPLSQVFQNLISNSLKYAKKDVPPIIKISVEEKKDCWQFSIMDNGEGIGEMFYHKIFIIFQRLHTKEEVPGTGLGLAITKKAIENMGGTIWVESEVGVGSTFFFTIAKALMK